MTRRIEIIYLLKSNELKIQQFYLQFLEMKESQQQKHEQIDQAVQSVKQKMKIVNFNNFEPPYLLHTLTKFRQTNFSKFLKDIKIEGEKDEAIREKLKIVHYVIEKFDDDCFDIYSSQLIQPYTRRMFQDNYEFDNIKFKQVNTQFNLNSEIQETLSQAAQWLTQIQITQDLLSRAQLYFKLKIPHVIEKVREQGLKSQKNTWFGAIVSNIKKLLSFGLRKGSKMVQTTFFTAVAPGALMLTLAIIGGSATLPWKSAISVNNLITIAAAAAVPFILDSMADEVQKSDYQVKLKKWAQTFELLSDSVRNFNEKLEEAIRNCTISSNMSQFQIERTNLQKIIHQLNKNIQSVIKYDEDKYTEMRDRTQAYFKQYIEIKQDEWTLILSKQEMEELNQINNNKKKDQTIQSEKKNKKIQNSTNMEEDFTLL